MNYRNLISEGIHEIKKTLFISAGSAENKNVKFYIYGMGVMQN
jgi:hypothetical protein